MDLFKRLSLALQVLPLCGYSVETYAALRGAIERLLAERQAEAVSVGALTPSMARLLIASVLREACVKDIHEEVTAAA
jgi:hypothetical protein